MICMMNTRKQFYLWKVEAENAFDSINRNVILHTNSVLCTIIATYISNCLSVSYPLFVIGGKEVLSKEGTTQRDPTSKGTCTLECSFIDMNSCRKLEIKIKN